MVPARCREAELETDCRARASAEPGYWHRQPDAR